MEPVLHPLLLHLVPDSGGDVPHKSPPPAQEVGSEDSAESKHLFRNYLQQEGTWTEVLVVYYILN